MEFEYKMKNKILINKETFVKISKMFKIREK